jgi:5'-3' exonuclease
MKRLILIDGINFFYRGAWGGSDVCTVKGEDMSYVLAYFRNLIGLIRRFGTDDENKYIICWDGGYDERLRISSEAVEKGLIPKSYKQERRESHDIEDPEERAKAESFMRQMKVARDMTGYTIIGQMWKKGEEADDLIGSYSVKYKDNYDEILLVTTDKDYYQLLTDKVRIFNSGKCEYKDITYLKTEYNLDNGEQWVDVGALAGESGKSSDTIYGVPGIGYTTAAKLISQYGTLDNLIKTAKLKLNWDIIKCGGSAKNLYDKVKSKEYKLKEYKKEMTVIAHEEIVDLAKQLKRIRTFLDLPLPELNASWFELDKCFKNMGFPIPNSTIEDLTDIGRYGY